MRPNSQTLTSARTVSMSVSGSEPEKTDNTMTGARTAELNQRGKSEVCINRLRLRRSTKSVYARKTTSNPAALSADWQKHRIGERI